MIKPGSRTESKHSPAKDEDVLDRYVSPAKQKAAQEGTPYNVDIEVTRKCPHTCLFCSFSSGNFDDIIPTGKMLEIIDHLKELGYQQIFWSGGEPLLHPDIYKLVRYARDQGIGNGLFSGGLPLTKKRAKEVYELYKDKIINIFAIHLDSINQESFNKIHSNPKELGKRIAGYQNLLETGFPPDRVFACLTLTKAAAETIEETIDWYLEMGARFIEISRFLPIGFGTQNRHFEPSLSDMRRAYEYRSKRLGGENWLRIGSTECSSIQCRTNLCLACDGSVMLCGNMPREFSVGNFYEESLIKIVRENWEVLSHRNLKIKGKCGDCENNDICCGCRAAAYHYLGDFEESDPKCWLNPAAKEVYDNN